MPLIRVADCPHETVPVLLFNRAFPSYKFIPSDEFIQSNMNLLDLPADLLLPIIVEAITSGAKQPNQPYPRTNTRTARALSLTCKLLQRSMYPLAYRSCVIRFQQDRLNILERTLKQRNIGASVVYLEIVETRTRPVDQWCDKFQILDELRATVSDILLACPQLRALHLHALDMLDLKAIPTTFAALQHLRNFTVLVRSSIINDLGPALDHLVELETLRLDFDHRSFDIRPAGMSYSGSRAIYLKHLELRDVPRTASSIVKSMVSKLVVKSAVVSSVDPPIVPLLLNSNSQSAHLRALEWTNSESLGTSPIPLDSFAACFQLESMRLTNIRIAKLAVVFDQPALEHLRDLALVDLGLNPAELLCLRDNSILPNLRHLLYERKVSRLPFSQGNDSPATEGFLPLRSLKVELSSICDARSIAAELQGLDRDGFCRLEV